MRLSLIAVLLVAACDDALLPSDAGEATSPLGMNDVTVLVPLPTDRAQPVIAKLALASPTLLPVNLVTGLVLASEIGPKTNETIGYDDFHIVGIRFDPCARDHIGTCHDDEDGRLRLILQPLYGDGEGTAAHDIALHAFYTLPNAELPAIVADLRALASLQAAPPSSALTVSPALVVDPAGAYAQRLRTLVLTYARETNLVQLTAIGQDKFSAAFAWLFGGYIKRAGAWELIPIPALAATRQRIQVTGGDTIYESTPAVDAPYRVGLAMNGALWAAASPDEQHLSLETLAEIENPTRHDTNDMQCAVCHISTFLGTRRAASINADLGQLARRYQTTWNISVDNLANQDGRVVRALGWAAHFPIVSRRVANDTAYVLEELSRRFP